MADHQPSRSRTDPGGGCQGALSRPGRAVRRGGVRQAREVPAAGHGGPPVEGPPAGPRPPQRGHRSEGLRPAQPARRVQARVVRPVRGHVGEHRGPRGEVPLSRRAGGRVPATAPGRDHHVVPSRGAGTRRVPRPAGACREHAGGRSGSADHGPPRPAQGGTQRPVPVRLGQEVQKVLRGRLGGREVARCRLIFRSV